MSNTHRLERVQLVRRPLPEVFAFFTRAENLEAITPPYLRFSFAGTPPTETFAGMKISYRLRLFGVPMRWTSVIEQFEPGQRFVDVQTRGPYKSWRHLHEFRAVPEGTEVRDRVDYQLPLGPLGDVAHALVVRRTLAGIFDHRQTKVRELLEGSAAPC